MEDMKYEGLKLENQLCFPLYAASREIIKHYRPFLEKIDLTYTQYIAMMVFWQEGSINVKELGKKLYLDSGTLTPVLKTLEAKGYITRSRSDEDERVVIASITPEGMALKDDAAEVPPKIACCVKLSPEEAQLLYGLLYKLLGCF
ncbi:MAG: MarR family transcriptional regulator [Ruminococcus sp.]|nr:MarR family transcriptional regulator [Ruminococcus sp.]